MGGGEQQSIQIAPARAACISMGSAENDKTAGQKQKQKQ